MPALRTRRSCGAVAASASDTTTRRPKPSSLRLSAIARASGDHANERCPGPHDGSACSCASASTHVGSVTDAGDGPHVHPAVELGDERERVARRREARLTDRDVVTTATTVGIASASSTATRDDARAVPRHVREVPLVPRERATVGRPRRDPTRSRRATPAAATRRRRGRRPRRRSCRRARARTRPGCRRATTVGAAARPSRDRTRAPARRSPAIDEEPAVGRGVDQRVVVDPAVAHRRRRRRGEVTGTSAVTMTSGPRPSAGATTRSTRPPNASSQARRVPPGDQRASPRVRDRATAAAEMPVMRPEAKRSDLHVRRIGVPSARLFRSCRLSPRVSASPGWSTGATRTAAARGSTPATSPGS